MSASDNGDDVKETEFMNLSSPGAIRTQSILRKKREIENRTLLATENSLSKQQVPILFSIVFLENLCFRNVE